MWPWWIDVMLTAGAVGVAAYALVLLKFNRLTRGLNNLD